jgi:hypothetical protein
VILFVGLVFLINPFHAVSQLLSRSTFLYQLIRGWYFLASITAALAILATMGLDAIWRNWQRRRSCTVWPFVFLAAATLLWCARLLIVWYPGGSEFKHGNESWRDPLTTLGLFTCLAVARACSVGKTRDAMGVMLVALSFIELKAFGTCKRFNATREPAPVSAGQTPLGFESAAVQRMADDVHFRIAVSAIGPRPAELRSLGLTTPQGFDPLMPGSYRDLVQTSGTFISDREFVMDPGNDSALQLLGVKYFVLPGSGEEFMRLQSRDSKFRLVGTGTEYFKIFQYLDAKPAYAWEGSGTARITPLEWRPETRAFEVSAGQAGRFRLTEQFYPGWRATVNGIAAPISRCHGAFQCVGLPAGTSRLEFRFRSAPLRMGLFCSAVTILLMVAALCYYGRSAREAASKRRSPAQ